MTQRFAGRSRGISLAAAAALLAGLIVAFAAEPVAVAGPPEKKPKRTVTPLQRSDPVPLAASDETFGLAVSEFDDSVAKIVGMGGGLRVLGIRPGSLGERILYAPASRKLDRGDFILRIWVRESDPEELTPRDRLTSKDAFVEACKRARRIIAERPEMKGEVVFDVWTLAGYNVEDYKMLSYSVLLDLNLPSSPSPGSTPGTGTGTGASPGVGPDAPPAR